MHQPGHRELHEGHHDERRRDAQLRPHALFDELGEDERARERDERVERAEEQRRAVQAELRHEHQWEGDRDRERAASEVCDAEIRFIGPASVVALLRRLAQPIVMALGRLPENVDRPQAEDIRAWDRGLLWSTLKGGDRPSPDDTAPVVDAAIAHIAATPCTLAIVPLEDLTGEVEQPNLPGTTTEHPNWRRRLEVPTDALLADPQVQKGMDVLRRRP
mgnify:CR=1 FL=1